MNAQAYRLQPQDQLKKIEGAIVMTSPGRAQAYDYFEFASSVARLRRDAQNFRRRQNDLGGRLERWRQHLDEMQAPRLHRIAG